MEQQQNDNSNIDDNKNSSNESIEEILLWNNIETTIPFHASHDDNGVISNDDDDEIKEPQHAVTFRTLATTTITTTSLMTTITMTTIPLSDLVGIYSRVNNDNNTVSRSSSGSNHNSNDVIGIAQGSLLVLEQLLKS